MFPIDLDVSWYEDYWYPSHPAHPSAVQRLRDWRPDFLRRPSAARPDDRPMQDAVTMATADELSCWPI